MANEKTPVVWDDTAKKHRPLGSGEKMGGLSASSMISTDSGNLLQQGSDGLMLVTGSSLADPRADNLLEESDGGKLQVTSDRIAEWLDGHPQAAAAIADAVKVVSEDSGNVIVQGTDKGAYLPKQAISSAVSTMTDAQKNQLADAISSRIASDIADGKTVTASGGKLTFDPTNATAAQKKAINQALSDPASGLSVDASTGRLGVDFSQMPTDKFEDLLKSLDMLVPLRANLDLYVGLNGSDAIEDGRGTQAKPFRTLGAATQYVASTYNIGSYHVTIYLMSGDYGNANISLPAFSATTGTVLIRSLSGNKSDVRVGGLRAASAGANYNIMYLTATHAPFNNGTAGAFQAENGARLTLRDVTADLSGVVVDPGTLWGFYASTNGIVEWWAYPDSATATGVSFVASSSSRIGGCMYAENGGTVSFASDINVSGTFSMVSAFAMSNRFGSVLSSLSSYINPGRSPRINVSGTVTGRRYAAGQLSLIVGRGNSTEAGAEYYPGDVEGTATTGSQYTLGAVTGD